MSAEPNGKSQVAMWSGIIVAGVAVMSAFASVSYSAFSQLSTIQLRLNTSEQSLNEIETQFCAQDHVRNLMHANDLRNFAILWEKTFGGKYPIENAYYPTICNRKTKQ